MSSNLICCFCDVPITNDGNNPEPLLSSSYKCCDNCNITRIIPIKHTSTPIQENQELITSYLVNGKKTTVPITQVGGITVNSKYHQSIDIFVSGCDAGFDDVVINTPESYLDTGIKVMLKNKGLARHIFNSSWNMLKKTKQDVMTGTEEERETFSRILLDHYISRYVLFEKEIPITLNPEIRRITKNIKPGECVVLAHSD